VLNKTLTRLLRGAQKPASAMSKWSGLHPACSKSCPVATVSSRTAQRHVPAIRPSNNTSVCSSRHAKGAETISGQPISLRDPLRKEAGRFMQAIRIRLAQKRKGNLPISRAGIYDDHLRYFSKSNSTPNSFRDWRTCVRSRTSVRRQSDIQCVTFL